MKNFKSWITNNKETLLILLKQYRDEYMDSECSTNGTCHFETEGLQQYLNDKGIKTNRVNGYYLGASDYYDPRDFMDLDEIDEDDDLRQYPHWWLETEDYILDVTVDQFHPDNPDDYYTYIQEKPDSDYVRLDAKSSKIKS